MRIHERMTLHDLHGLDFQDFCQICMIVFKYPIVPTGIAQVPCTEEFYLYEDTESGACIRMRLWSRMLSIFAVRPGGEWLLSSHVERPSITATMREAFRQFKEALLYMEDDSPRSTIDLIQMVLNHDYPLDSMKFLSYFVEARYREKCLKSKELMELMGLSKYRIRKLLNEYNERAYIRYNYTVKGWYLTNFGYGQLPKDSSVYEDMITIWETIVAVEGEKK